MHSNSIIYRNQGHEKCSLNGFYFLMGPKWLREAGWALEPSVPKAGIQRLRNVFHVLNFQNTFMAAGLTLIAFTSSRQARRLDVSAFTVEINPSGDSKLRLCTACRLRATLVQYCGSPTPRMPMRCMIKMYVRELLILISVLKSVSQP